LAPITPLSPYFRPAAALRPEEEPEPPLPEYFTNVHVSHRLPRLVDESRMEVLTAAAEKLALVPPPIPSRAPPPIPINLRPSSLPTNDDLKIPPPVPPMTSDVKDALVEMMDVERPFPDGDVFKVIANAPPDDRKAGYHETLHINFLVDPHLQMQLGKLYPGMKFNPTPGSTTHTHPLLALERRFSERYIISALKCPPEQTIIDIGGNAQRHFAAKRRNVWCCCPLLDPDDVVRQSRYSKDWKTWCSHKFQDCNCRVPYAYISIHSLYYLSPEDVLESVHSCTLRTHFAAVHIFDNAYGSYYNGEAVYHVSTAGLVTMSVPGNNHPYQHSACMWWRDGYFVKDGRAMAWSLTVSVHNTSIYKFVAAPNNLTIRTIQTYSTLTTAIRDVNHYGPIKFSGNVFRDLPDKVQVDLVPVYFSAATYMSYGTYILVCPDSTAYNFVLPKPLIREAAGLIIGEIRDLGSWNRLLRHVKTRIGNYDIPPEILDESILLSTLYGFTCTLELENQVLIARNKSIAPNGLADVTNTLNENKMQDLTLPVVGALTTTSLGFGACAYYAPSVRWFAFSLFSITGSLAFAMYVRSRYKSDQKLCNLQRGLDVHRTSHESYPVTGYLCFSGIPYSFKTIDTLKFNKLIRPYCRLSLSNNLTKERGGSVTLAVGIFQPDKLPVVYGPSQHNLTQAVAGRIVGPRPDRLLLDPKGDIWKAYVNFCEDHDNIQFMYGNQYDTPVNARSFYCHVDVTVFRAWFQRFNKSAKLKIIEGEIEAQIPVDYRKACSMGIFVKGEKTLHSDPTVVKCADPRAISTRKPTYNYILGAFCWLMNKKMAQLWHRKHFITYTSGMNAEALGHHISMTHYHHPHRSDADIVRCDQSLHAEFLERRVDRYKDRGLPLEGEMLLRSDISKRGASDGVVYSSDGNVGSGSPDTMLGNTEDNASAQCFTVCVSNGEFSLRKFVTEHDYRLTLLSDDSIDSAAKAYEFNPNIMSALGLKIERNIRKDHRDLEFCSGYVWPTDSGHVYTVKPGRALAKSGFYLDLHPKNALATHAQTVNQYRVNYSFVPFMGAYFSHQHKLCAGAKGKFVRTRDHWMYNFNIHNAGTIHKSIPQTYDMFYHLYGLDQLAIEKMLSWLATITSLPAVLSTPETRAIVQRDCESNEQITNFLCLSAADLTQIAQFIYLPMTLFESFRLTFNDICYHSVGLVQIYDLIKRPFPPRDYLFQDYFYFMGGFVLCEELFKKISIFSIPIGVVFFLIFESTVKLLTRNATPVQLIAPTLLHLVTWKLPIVPAVIVHFIWNTTVMVFDGLVHYKPP
jgi:hypothetical protein